MLHFWDSVRSSQTGESLKRYLSKMEPLSEDCVVPAGASAGLRRKKSGFLQIDQAQDVLVTVGLGKK